LEYFDVFITFLDGPGFFAVPVVSSGNSSQSPTPLSAIAVRPTCWTSFPQRGGRVL